jgi:hypothetical protein
MRGAAADGLECRIARLLELSARSEEPARRPQPAQRGGAESTKPRNQSKPRSAQERQPRREALDTVVVVDNRCRRRRLNGGSSTRGSSRVLAHNGQI